MNADTLKLLSTSSVVFAAVMITGIKAEATNGSTTTTHYHSTVSPAPSDISWTNNSTRSIWINEYTTQSTTYQSDDGDGDGDSGNSGSPGGGFSGGGDGCNAGGCAPA